MLGKMFVVGLPIGNLQDISQRAVAVLSEVDVVVAEDTRQIIKLARMLDLPRLELRSYRDQIHERAFPEILANLQQGKDVALVSDRGTPTISDPGYKLVRDLQTAGVEVVTVPGPSAVISALSISGLPTDKFMFLGFLPRSKNKQIAAIREAIEIKATFVAYESPHRLIKTLKNIAAEFDDRIELALAHELTKVHEEVLRDAPTRLLESLADREIKGEWVVMGAAVLE